MTYHIVLTHLAGASDEQKDALVRVYREMLERLLGGADKVVPTWLAAQAEIEAQRQSTLEPMLGGASGRWDLFAAMARRSALETWTGESDDARFEFNLIQ